MTLSYIFYDLETSGLHKSFDQVQQYAAMRVDAQWQKLACYYEEARLSADVVPSAYAAITHRLDLTQESKRQSEYSAVCAIHRHLNEPQTISLGYNTLGFDDEFLRFAFHRHLLSPYTHQYAQGCRRMDVFPIAVCYYLYRPGGIEWPMRDGRASFRLEDIVSANGWQVGPAHHAMHDVDATFRLARELRQSDPVMWSFLEGYFDKRVDMERCMRLPRIAIGATEYSLGLMWGGSFGVDAEFQSAVVCLGNHSRYKNQQMWLRLDRERFEDKGWAVLGEGAEIVRKKLGEPYFCLPYEERFYKKMTVERRQTVQDNIKFISQNTTEWQALETAIRREEYPQVEGVDIDADLYLAGFESPEEVVLSQKFHHAKEKQRIAMLLPWKKTRWQQRALRCLWRMGTQELPEILQGEINTYTNNLRRGIDLPTDYRGRSRPTIADLQQQIQDLHNQEHLDREQKEILTTLSSHYVMTSAKELL